MLYDAMLRYDMQDHFVESLFWSDQGLLASTILIKNLSYVKRRQDDESNFQQQLSYFHNFGVSSHFEGYTGAQGQTQHADAAAVDLRMLLQDFIGLLHHQKHVIQQKQL